MFLINSKYGLNKPITVFMEKLLSYLYAICLLLSYLNSKVVFFVLCDRATAVCPFIFAAQCTPACGSLQVLGVTDSKNFSISFSLA